LGADRNRQIQGRHRSISQRRHPSGTARGCAGWPGQHRWNRLLLAWGPAAPGDGAVVAVGLFSSRESGGAGLGLDAPRLNQRARRVRRNRQASGQDRSESGDGRWIRTRRSPIHRRLLGLSGILGSREGCQRGLAEGTAELTRGASAGRSRPPSCLRRISSRWLGANHSARRRAGAERCSSPGRHHS